MRKIAIWMWLILLVGTGGLASWAASGDNVSSLFVPPLTDKEMTAYQKIANDNKAVQRFIETRQFVRKVAAFVKELPKGVEYAPSKHGCPQPTADVDGKYALTFSEQLNLFGICMLCGGCGGDMAELAPTGEPLCGMKHPKQFECGNPVDRNSVLSQLTPPASTREIELFEKANKCAAAEMPRFLATRKYMREIHKLEAALPAGQKLDPGKAPRIPDLIDSTYFLDNEVFILMDIQRAEIEKDMTDRNKAKGSGK